MTTQKLKHKGEPQVRSNSVVRERRVAVSLSQRDWLDLANFIGGDIDNMEEGCPIKAQMARIKETIYRRALSNVRLSDSRP